MTPKAHTMNAKAPNPHPTTARDLSWMHFNHRLIVQAQKNGLPLLERLRFLGIYANNLDEFFRVRMAALYRLVDSAEVDKETRARLQETIAEILRLHADYDQELEQTTAEVFRCLATEAQLNVLELAELSAEQQTLLKAYFYETLSGWVHPIWLSELRDLSTLDEQRIYLAVSLHLEWEGQARYALIKLPDRQLGRWVRLPSTTGVQLIYLDDVVRYCLPLIFQGVVATNFVAYAFKLTKDAEMDIEAASDLGVREQVWRAVHERRKGRPVRLVYDAQMPKALVQELTSRLRPKKRWTQLATGRYPNHRDLMNFPNCGLRQCCYEPHRPLLPAAFTEQGAVLHRLRDRDEMLHFPYHSFDAFLRVLREAAINPEVKEVQMTIYRLAKDSKVVKALIAAARNGKRVRVVIELMARFDEQRNIKYSRKLQEAGVEVCFGIPDLKVHAKLVHLRTTWGEVACIGTGNFHEGNATAYTDRLLMTTRQELTCEVARVFDFIRKPYLPVSFKHLLVAPNWMQSQLLQLIAEEIKIAKRERPAWIHIKINHITELTMVEALYAAAEAGVKVILMLRGNCALAPKAWQALQRPQLKDRLFILRTIGRFLEHERVFGFSNDGHPLYYIGSADWMERNLARRVEVLAPVYDEALKDQLDSGFNRTWLDGVDVQYITGEGDDDARKEGRWGEAAQSSLLSYYKSKELH